MATVSRKFHGNQAFFADFKKGKRSVTLSKFEEMMGAFGKEWPAECARPQLDAVPMGLDPGQGAGKRREAVTALAKGKK